MDSATDDGAAVLTGGSAPDRTGYYYQPTVLDSVPPGAGILSEEIFGPVAPIVRFTDPDEAIRLANSTEYGLVSYVYSVTCAGRCALQRHSRREWSGSTGAWSPTRQRRSAG